MIGNKQSIFYHSKANLFLSIDALITESRKFIWKRSADLLVIKYDIWYPNFSRVNVYLVNTSITSWIPGQKWIFPFLKNDRYQMN